MNIINNILRTAMVCFAAMMVGVVAVAQNKLYIEDFSIVPGQETTVNLVLENTDNISSLQFDIDFPEGLEFVPGSEERNTERITRTSHTLTVSQYDQYNEQSKRFTIFAKGVDTLKTAIKGHSGVILSFQVEADESFTGGKLIFSEAYGSDATITPATEKDIVVVEGVVKANVGTFSLSADSVSMFTTKNDTVHFYLANTIDVVGMEARLTLPDGIKAEVIMGDRLSDNTEVNYVASTGKILVSSMMNDVFAETDAPVFSIVLTATDIVTGDIILNEVVVSDKKTPFAIEGEAKVAVDVLDINKIVYGEMTVKLDSAQNKLADTLEVISNYTTDAGKAFAESEEAKAIAAELDSIKAELDSLYAAGLLTDVNDFEERIAAVEERIDVLAREAAAADAAAKIVVGDVNDDGEVTIADANAIVNYFLGNEQEGFIREAADVNGDGEITVADANAVVNMYLNK